MKITKRTQKWISEVSLAKWFTEKGAVLARKTKPKKPKLAKPYGDEGTGKGQIIGGALPRRRYEAGNVALSKKTGRVAAGNSQ